MVGSNGRVIAFEPIPETFELLAANASQFSYKNVSLFNAALSDKVTTVGMSIPKFSSGLCNYYMANISDIDATYSILTISLNSFSFPESIKLIKIDAEGHELFVLKGIEQLLTKDLPKLIIEENSEDVKTYLYGLGYKSERLDGSPNSIYTA